LTLFSLLVSQFYLYNLLLRRYPLKEYEEFQEGGNLFATTIYVLCSAVNKLARHVKIAEGTLLYRGLGGKMELPDSFYVADENGRRGYCEWGFMSTTSSKQTALQYSGVKEGSEKAMVLEMAATAVDRGASVGSFSQYPQASEDFINNVLFF
jgi:hypothetical protein